MSLRRGIFSLFILVHLFVIGVLPNRMSKITQATLGFFEPYMNFFEMTANWNFFAPEPGPPPLYLEWEIDDSKGNELGSHRFPEATDPFFLRDRQNRRVAIARFMFMSDERYLRIWGEYVCKNRPEANAVRLWRVILDVPGLTDTAEGKKRIGDFDIAERRSIGHVFCSTYREKR